ncbi:hypothetical protein [Flavobacterium granuli]|uniref:Uncharacterized protein n=1 Tax=Flavobacterium granuli TaxID=280093 RepID=A0ABU1S1B1_9FLAO|nr:hypothetical protein [Flavobacterium granuli]MDR6844817.1 hypothetical protein [Flavobacterium granuli]
MKDSTKKWILNVSQEELTLQERKDAMIMIAMLNVCGDYVTAITKIKEFWIDGTLPLLPISDAGYSARKVARSLAMKRIKNAYAYHITLA